MCHESWQSPDGMPPGRPDTFTAADGVAIPAWRYGGNTKGVCLVLPDIYGPSPFYHTVSAMLAEAGYAAVMIDYFFREGPIADRSREAAFARRAGMDENRCLDDISAVIDQLVGEGAGPRVGLLGFCLSGTFAFDLTAMRADLVTTTFYGFPEGPGGPVVSRAPRPIDIAARFRGPIQSFWGDQDNIPLPLIERFGAEVARHAVDYRQHVYPGVGHAFLQGLVVDDENSASAHDAWKRTLEFLGRTLSAHGSQAHGSQAHGS